MRAARTRLPWRLLELVSEPSSIDYRVHPGPCRDKVLHVGSSAARRVWRS